MVRSSHFDRSKVEPKMYYSYKSLPITLKYKCKLEVKNVSDIEVAMTKHKYSIDIERSGTF